jgi:uncharacterized membrane protein YhdT
MLSYQATRRPGVVHVGFVVDKVALGQVFLLIIWFSFVIIIPPWLFMLICHLGDSLILLLLADMHLIDDDQSKISNQKIEKEKRIRGRPSR